MFLQLSTEISQQNVSTVLQASRNSMMEETIQKKTFMRRVVRATCSPGSATGHVRVQQHVMYVRLLDAT